MRNVRHARLTLLALLAFTLAAVVPGLISEANAAGSMVTLRSGDEFIQVYLAVTEKPAKGGPAMVLVHEWWGLSDWVKGVADRYAAQGYPEIAPGLKRARTSHPRPLCRIAHR
jgi:hypothetical protein